MPKQVQRPHFWTQGALLRWYQWTRVSHASSCYTFNMTPDVRQHCYSLSAHPHADHPLRRKVLGPIPSHVASNQMLLAELERLGLANNAGLGASVPLSDANMIFSKRWNPRRAMRQRSVRSSQRLPRLPRRKRRGSTSIVSSPSSPHETPTSPLSTIPEGLPASAPVSPTTPLPVHTPPSDTVRSKHRPPSIHTLTPNEQSSSLNSRSKSSDTDSLFSPRSHYRHAWPHHGKLRRLGVFSPHSAATPLVWDETWATTEELDSEKLDEEERKNLISQLSITFLHQKMLGDSFEVGRTFFEQILKEEAETEVPVSASAPPSIHMSPCAAKPLASSRHDNRNELVSKPRFLSSRPKRMPFGTHPKNDQAHVKFALPNDSNEIEDRTGWDAIRQKLESEGAVSTHTGRPSNTMLALENELDSKRAELTEMVSSSHSLEYGIPHAPPNVSPPTIDTNNAGTHVVPLTSPHETDMPSDDKRRRKGHHWIPHPTVPQWFHDRQKALMGHKKVGGQSATPYAETSHSKSSASLETLAAEPTLDEGVHKVSEKITMETVTRTPTPPRPSDSSLQLKNPIEAHNEIHIPSPHRVAEVAHTSTTPMRLPQSLEDGSIPVGLGDQSPPPVDEVLSRPIVAPVPSPATPNDHACLVLKRDRMLVKVQVATSDVMGADFDEFEARRYDVRSFRWAEYVVILRPGRLELWSESSVCSHVLGDSDRLKLRYSVSLRPEEATLSLYSETDRLLCLTCPRPLGTMGRLPFRRHGSMILILNARTFTAAADWMWLLWRELGGSVPPHVFVYIPGISMRVRVPIPKLPDIHGLSREYDTVLDVPSPTPIEDYEEYMPAALLREARRLVKAVPQWASLAEDMRARGLSPTLAWRSGTIYNWVLYDHTPEGAKRYWNVLVGALLTNRRRAPVLELVMNNHYPTHVLHPSGHALSEPCGVEGFVGRLRNVSNVASRVYLSVHDGCVFLLRESYACVPDAFTGVPLGPIQGATRKERLSARIKQFEHYERVRESYQIRHSEGFIDLRDVCAIGHVETGIVLSIELQRHMMQLGQDPILSSALKNAQCVHDYDGTRTAIDRRLEEVLRIDSTSRPMRRFQLFLNNGREVVFECASPSLACDWIVHLFMLTVYWRCRQKTDIRMLMNASGNRREHRYGAAYVDDLSLLSLPYLWNWCRIDHCRAVNLMGHLFWRTNARHPFRRRVFVLCNGQILGFKLMSSTRTSTSRQNEGIVYRHKGAPILLRDAYVYTGQMSDRSSDLQSNEFSIARSRNAKKHEIYEQLPRLYRDGLTSSESHEECSFVLHVRRKPDSALPTHLSGHTAPSIAPRDYTEYMFRARTVLERDIWVRQICIEIEKIVRADPKREESIRRFGRIH